MLYILLISVKDSVGTLPCGKIGENAELEVHMGALQTKRQLGIARNSGLEAIYVVNYDVSIQTTGKALYLVKCVLT